MRAVSNDYISGIKEFGKQITTKLEIIDYDANNDVLHTWYFDDQYNEEEENIDTYHLNASENINSLSFNYNGQLFSSIMKQCIIDINKDVYPNETGTRREIDVYFGLLVESSYEYIQLGKFLIKEMAEAKDSNSFKITCYDKLLLSMVEYSGIDITYPITLRNYIGTIATHLGLTFYNASDTFPNYDKELEYDLYLDNEGATLGYTFRDILDDIAEATGRTFIVDGNNLKLVATPTTSVATIDEEYLKDINVDFGKKYGVINKLSLTRSADSDVIYRADETSIENNGETEISFKDNQLLSQEDREDWIDAIFNEIKGIEYYINDYSSQGITFLEPLDRYSVSINNETYSCLMLSDEINITQGLEENIHSDMPDTSKTDYKTSSQSDKTALQTTLIVNKQLGQIVGEVATKTDLSNLQGQIDANGEAIESLGTRVTQTESNITFATNTLNELVDENGNVTSVKNSLVTINADGIQVQTNTSAINTQMTNDAFIISDTTGQLARFDDDGANLDNLSVDHYLTMGVHRVEKYDNNTRTGFFYIGG